jgi:ATP-binding cassette subfamily B protein
MRFPFYKQPDSKDCGPTCLKMVARFYNKSIPLQTIRDKCQITREGVNLLGISDAAEMLHFRTQCVKVSLEVLKEEIPLPAIIHWNQNHFIVLYKIKRGKFYVADPGIGLVSYKEDDFKYHWISDRNISNHSGVALLLQPSPDFYTEDVEVDDSKSRGIRLNSMVSYLSPYKKLIFQLFLGLFVSSIFQLFIPFLTQSIVDTGISTSDIDFIYIILLAQLALFIGKTAVEFLRGWLLLHISVRINISILNDFLIKLMRLPISFFESKLTGDLLQRLNDHTRIEYFLTGSSLSTIFSIFNLIIFSIVLVFFDFRVFLIFAFASFLYTAWVIVFLKIRRKLDNRQFVISSKEQSTTIQIIQGMQEIKLNGVEKQMRWKWEQLQASKLKINIRTLSVNQWQQSGALFINEVKNILITFLSATAVVEGKITLGSMLAIQYIIGQLNSPIEQMIGFIQSWQRAKISIDRFNEIHTLEDEEPVNSNLLRQIPLSAQKYFSGGTGTDYLNNDYAPIAEDFSNQQSLLQTQGFKHTDNKNSSIRFTNVSFTYPGAGNEPAINNISFDVLNGKTTAIVGSSGSGKTTLLKLILKFYDPQGGEIRIGNIPLSQISHSYWRSICGVVMQESFIFSDTIARNIAVGVSDVDIKRLYNAARLANILSFIENLPLGFNTIIGSEGNGISMGQRQRILIARAVYRNPEFILLDEATNSLDANNESTIVGNLTSFFKGKTVLVVAHRLSTVKNADHIIVMNRGRIIEQGNHNELVSMRGEYYSLVSNQLEIAK